jgi:hypothetical protein
MVARISTKRIQQMAFEFVEMKGNVVNLLMGYFETSSKWSLAVGFFSTDVKCIPQQRDRTRTNGSVYCDWNNSEMSINRPNI